ncbi:DUF3047 domain-containing protein [Trichloromonas acetexigens]|uniref:DUF3047 domain-containing protein n=1 Tax=Trichloromonas acetexigens TaxID=38815 RepID=A0A550JGD1_9BACT|nr:DUF3047 domain-containing protein [Desulfuromonas acetexigens]TRO82269.1 DUF3047 domain-containing protein [Desulfuromonas acetexigens]
MKLSACLLAALIFLCLPGPAVKAGEIAVGRFAEEGLAGWEVKEFEGLTRYRLVEEEGRRVLLAEADGSASGLVKKIAFDPAEYRYLRWRWKIEETVAQGDERTKAGDDYAARVYVIFPGRFFWQTRALNYIWANRLPAEGFVANAFTANAMLLAVRSGADQAGQWLEESRDLIADYRRVFGSDPPQAGAVAIMTDTDNTGGRARAWYGDISLSTQP